MLLTSFTYISVVTSLPSSNVTLSEPNVAIFNVASTSSTPDESNSASNVHLGKKIVKPKSGYSHNSTLTLNGTCKILHLVGLTAPTSPYLASRIESTVSPVNVVTTLIVFSLLFAF